MQSFARLSAVLAVCALGRTGLADPNTAGAPPPATPATPTTPATPAPPAAPASTGPAESAPSAPPTPQAPPAVPAPGTAAEPPPAPGGPPPAVVAVDPARLYSGPVPVWFSGDENQSAVVSVYPDWTTSDSIPPLAQCRMPCGFQMQRGRYRIAVAETEDTLGGSRSVAIEGPARLVITPREHSKRTAGLALGIGGAVAVVAGVIVLANGANNSHTVCTGEGCHTAWNTEMTSGTILFLAGCAATPIGWVMFGKSLHPAIDVEPARVASRPTGRVGLVPFPGGAGLGGTFVF